jgi:TDG/mug DNA glycosylase family protein
MNRLPDQLQHHLRLVFVGTAAGQRSVDLGHYYAHPGNRFWRTIPAVGLTPRRYQPHEVPALLEQRIGFTDMCKLACANLAREWTIRLSTRPSIVRLSAKKCCNID